MLEALASGRLRTPGTVLISPAPTHAYSGMLTGYLGGLYTRQAIDVDLEALTRRAGVQLVVGTALTLDPAARRLTLADGAGVPYDFLSLAIGSAAAGSDVPGVRAHACSLKPIDGAAEIGPALDLLLARGPAAVSVVVVGGGAAGVEVALNLQARLADHGVPGDITLLERGPRLLAERSATAARCAAQVLRRAGVHVTTNSAVVKADAAQVWLDSGAVLPAGLLVWAAGAAAPPLLAKAGLALDSRGFLLVDDTLQSVSHRGIFADGDTATLQRYPETPKAGVYAVRQGPVLVDNLCASLAGRAPERRYRPQRRYLALLNTGDGRAIFSYGPVAFTARWAMVLKDWIDRRFMRRFGTG